MCGHNNLNTIYSLQIHLLQTIKKIGYECTLHLWVEVKFNLIKNNANMFVGGDVWLYNSYLLKINNPITQEFLTLNHFVNRINVG